MTVSKGLQRNWTDDEMLMALHLRENKGWSCERVAEEIGVTRNSIIGLTNRIRTLMKTTDTDGNKNGTMPPLWWKRKDQK